MKTRTPPPFAALALPLILAACGGSGGSGDAGTTTGSGSVDSSGEDVLANNVTLDDEPDESTGPTTPDTDPAEPDTPGVAGPETPDPVEPETPDPVEPETPDRNADSDGDEQSDVAESTCGSDPGDADSLSPDADGDGLPDCFRGYPVRPVVGEPGREVDCRETLPCTWVAEDGETTMEIGFADGLARIEGAGAGGDLSTVLELVATNRDTTLTILDDAEGIDGEGTVYRSERLRRLPADDVNDGLPVALEAFAGTPVRVRLGFDEEFEGREDDRDTLRTLVIPFAENDARVDAEFANVPLGRAPSVDRDCDGILPCTWNSADGEFEITVDEVGVDLEGRLRVDFSVRSDLPDRTVRVTGAALAIGADSSRFTGTARRFGTSELTVALPLATDAVLPQGQPVTGRQVFREEPPLGLDALSRLQLRIYESASVVPAWNPVFRDLPIAR